MPWTPAPVRVGPPGPPEMTAAYVAVVKKWLQEQGTNLSGPCGAFAITKRVAWELRDTGAGVLHKPGGNNCEERATDIIVFRDGRAFDILFDGGNTNGPLFNPTEVDDAAGRWRAPVQP